MSRKAWKHSPKQYITLCHSLIGEPWRDTYRVYSHLDYFGSAAFMSRPQGHHQCWPSLPSPLEALPPCPWTRTPFQPSGSISPCRNDVAAMLVFSSSHPCPAWPRVPSIQAHPQADISARPHPEGGDSWSEFLAEPGYGLWVCPTPSPQYCGAGPLQSGWDDIWISSKHLTFCSWCRLSTTCHAPSHVCLLYLSFVFIKMLIDPGRFSVFHDLPAC